MTNGIIFCVYLINISHFSFTVCSEAVAKILQQHSGEERVTAKSRSSERSPSALSSTASESPGKTRQESQSPLSAQAEKYDRTEKAVVCRDTSHERHRLVDKAHSSSNSEWNIDKTWSSQEWKPDELMDDRTVKPVVCLQRGAPQLFVLEDDEAESDLSVGSRSFFAQGERSGSIKTKTIFNECNRRQRRAFCDMVDVHVCNIGIIGIHGEELLIQLTFHHEYRRSHNETDVRHI